jgi:hypothetical protein
MPPRHHLPPSCHMPDLLPSHSTNRHRPTVSSSRCCLATQEWLSWRRQPQTDRQHPQDPSPPCHSHYKRKQTHLHFTSATSWNPPLHRTNLSAVSTPGTTCSFMSPWGAPLSHFSCHVYHVHLLLLVPLGASFGRSVRRIEKRQEGEID